MTTLPGPIAFLGSGETSLAGGRIFESLARQASESLRVAVIETPAGFELNSAQVAGRIADYLSLRLQNYKPSVAVIPARKRNTAYSPDDPEILAPLASANFIFMGPGSPTYAIRQLKGSLAWEIIRARHRLGATLVFASAATIAVSQWALPVYEIYKVGMDVHTLPGLGIFDDFGVSLSFVPHWNNAEGGADLDTSRCFIGLDRFAEWSSQLPEDHTTLGLDEHTGIVFNFQARQASVMGVSSITLARPHLPKIHPAGSQFPLYEIGHFTLPEDPAAGIDSAAWQMAADSPQLPANSEKPPPPEVVSLAEARQQARLRKDWPAADDFRRQIEALGWQVTDTSSGPQLTKK